MIFFLWWGGSVLVASEIILPSPFSVLKKFLPLVCSEDFLRALGASIVRLLVGLAVSVPLGVGAGLAAGLNRRVAGFFSPFFSIIAATPVMSVILIAYLAFGAEKTPVFTSFLMIFPVMAANTIEGIRAIEPKMDELFKVYTLTKIQRLRFLYLPSLLPFLAGGLRSGLSLGWKVVIAAEVLVQPLSALGTGMQQAKAHLETPELFAWTAAAVAASAFSEFVLAFILRKI